jgi:GDP-L-fucose synthase
MRVLVPGGHGFVGRHVCAALTAAGHEALPVSRRDGVDLRDAGAVLARLRHDRPDAIVNCAAHVGSVHHVRRHAATVLHDNLSMALALYRAARDFGRPLRIVNPLSNCSYPGGSALQRETEWWDGAVHESVVASGNVKRMLRVLGDCYAIEHGIDSVALIAPNTYGPGDSLDPEHTHALNGMIIRMVQAKRRGDARFEIWGTGAPVREWGYVVDVARLLVAGLALPLADDAPVNGVLNLGQRRGWSIRQSAELIAEAVGFRGDLVFNPAYADGAPQKVMDDGQFRRFFPDFVWTDHRAGIAATVRDYEARL